MTSEIFKRKPGIRKMGKPKTPEEIFAERVALPYSRVKNMSVIEAKQLLYVKDLSLDDVEGVDAAWKSHLMNAIPLSKTEASSHFGDIFFHIRKFNQAKEVMHNHLKQKNSDTIARENVEVSEKDIREQERVQKAKDHIADEADEAKEREARAAETALRMQRDAPMEEKRIQEEIRRKNLIAYENCPEMSYTTAKQLLKCNHCACMDEVQTQWVEKIQLANVTASQLDPFSDIRDLNKAREVSFLQSNEESKFKQWKDERQLLIDEHQKLLCTYYGIGSDGVGEMEVKQAKIELKLDRSNDIKIVVIQNAWECAVLPETPETPAHPEMIIKKLNKAIDVMLVEYGVPILESWQEKMKLQLAEQPVAVHEQLVGQHEQIEQQNIKKRKVAKPKQQAAKKIKANHVVQSETTTETSEANQTDGGVTNKQSRFQGARKHEQLESYEEGRQLAADMTQLFTEKIEQCNGARVMFSDLYAMFLKSQESKGFATSKLEEQLFTKHCWRLFKAQWPHAETGQHKHKRCYVHVAAKPQ